MPSAITAHNSIFKNHPVEGWLSYLFRQNYVLWDGIVFKRRKKSDNHTIIRKKLLSLHPKKVTFKRAKGRFVIGVTLDEFIKTI